MPSVVLYSDTVHSVIYSDYQPGLFHSHNSQDRKKYNLLINEDLDGKPKDIVIFSSLYFSHGLNTYTDTKKICQLPFSPAGTFRHLFIFQQTLLS